MDGTDDLELGRRACERRDWGEAHERLAAAGERGSLDGSDLELLATAAYMLGRQGDYLAALERAHHAHIEAGAEARAVRAAFWLGTQLVLSGEVGPASGWLARAERLVERLGADSVERGYLRIPEAFRLLAAGDADAAARAAAEAAAIGREHSDHDLFALAAHEQGHLLIRARRTAEGLRLLDEAMVAATGEELSPIVTGIVYCGVILACQEALEPRRAREWTAALSDWCERQPDLVAFTGRCRVHRAEIMQLDGAWAEALAEAERAEERSLAGENRAAAGEAAYLRGELHRLRGELAAAERAYEEASRAGCEPLPGMALLRLAQGRAEAAAAAISRALAESPDPATRARLLSARVEVATAIGDDAGAAGAAAELEEMASREATAMLEAIAAGARGAAKLTAGDHAGALAALRRAWQGWEEIGAPYEAARIRVLIGNACGGLGDQDAARLELDAARETFAQLGAAADLARIDALSASGSRGEHGLSDRELEVLRHLAAGRSNREIAAELVISEHTVARHVQNIFAKLGVSSRTAASAYAFEHGLA